MKRIAVLGVCIVVTGVASLSMAVGASAAPPTCHGKKATIWTKKDIDKTIKGTSGRDVIVTANGNDTIMGRKGRDLICSHGGNDSIKGGPGLDRIYSGAGDDFASGWTGDDVICGYGGKDSIFGGPGDDWLSVGSGVNYFDADGSGDLNDSMYRQWVEDGYTYTIGIGSSGDDVMTGGMIHVQGDWLARRWRC